MLHDCPGPEQLSPGFKRSLHVCAPCPQPKTDLKKIEMFVNYRCKSAVKYLAFSNQLHAKGFLYNTGFKCVAVTLHHSAYQLLDCESLP